MSDPAPARRRDPAWVWYALAAGVLLLLGALDLLGVLEPLQP
ncbi:hypothetical protein [Miltoncostaea marina]|nr:hypothetical protein [Miltoncostaea marina]